MEEVKRVLSELPENKKLVAIGECGYAVILQSDKYPGYWHLYMYYLGLGDCGEAQETRKPCLPEGIAYLLDEQGANIGDFVAVEKSDWDRELNPAIFQVKKRGKVIDRPSLPPSKEIWKNIEVRSVKSVVVSQ